MKLWLMVLAAACVFTVGARAADEGTAAKPAAKAACCVAHSSCDAVLAKLTLTDEQKQKIAALNEECGKVSCPKTARTKCMKGLSEILTAEQFAQVKESCGKSGGCPMKKAEPKTE